MEPRKKLLYIITQGQWGGAQRYVFDLATNLADKFDISIAIGEGRGKRDLQDKILSAKGGSSPPRAGGKYSNIEIFSLKHLVRPILPWHDILAVWELAKLYRQLKPDIVHLNSTKAGVIGSLAKLLDSRFRGNDKRKDSSFRWNDNIKIVYTVHGWAFRESVSMLKRELYFWLEKITAKIKNKIILLSRSEYQDAVEKLKIPADKVEIIPHGIGASEKNYSREEARQVLQDKLGARLEGNAVWLGTIANLYPTKGLDILLEAIILKKDELVNTNVQFILIGEGPERVRLEKIIKENNLSEMVWLAGWMENASDLLPALDLFILPSRKEGYPYAVLEAMRARVPLIATAVGGLPEMIINKKTGLLVDSQNARELADAIIFALNNQQIMRDYANNAALEITSKAGLAAVVEHTARLYSSLD